MLEKFEEAEKDCDEAIKLNPDFIKAYYRRAKALLEKTSGSAKENDILATEDLKKGIEMARNTKPIMLDLLEEMRKLLESCEEEFRQDDIIPKDNPERILMDTLEEWLHV